MGRVKTRAIIHKQLKTNPLNQHQSKKKNQGDFR